MDQQQYVLVCKVVSLPTKDFKFRVQANEGTYTLHSCYGQLPELWLGDSLCCVITTIDDTNLQIVRYDSIEPPCDSKSFVYILMRALTGTSITAFKCLTLFKWLQKEYSADRDPCTTLSMLAKKGDTKSAMSLAKINDGKLFTYTQAETLLKWWKQYYDVRRLYSLGLKKEDLTEVTFSYYDLHERLRKNPYSVPEISMTLCASIDLKTERTVHPLDVYCGHVVRYMYSNVTSRSHTCTYARLLESKYGRVSEEDVREHLTKGYRVIIEELDVYPDNGGDPKPTEAYYLKDQYKVEKGLSDYLAKAVSQECFKPLGEPIFFDEALDSYQREAIKVAINNNVSIITGPAGSGKTRTVGTLISNLEASGVNYIVTSFTGKAVIRAKEMNGIEDLAATMHRILYGNFEPGPFRHVIFDESTMIDSGLMYAFISTYSHQFSMTFIGDINQLSPIPWGSFFHSCVSSRRIPCTVLESIHRVKRREDGALDGIIVNSERITKWPAGKMFPFETTDNFVILDGGISDLKGLLVKLKRQGYASNEVTIVTPYRRRKIRGKYMNYIDKVNSMCQLIWNEGKSYISVEDHRIGHESSRLFFVGDRVMMTKNNYDIDVFNGQEGYVTAISDKEIHINFPSVIVRKKNAKPKVLDSEYLLEMEITKAESVSETSERVYITKIVRVPFARSTEKKQGTGIAGPTQDKESCKYVDITLIELCYAMTVHKSQGSEWKCVIYYMPSTVDTASSFLNINLNYTGLTRASERLYILDSESNTSKTIANCLPRRYECMTSRLMSALPELYPYKEKVIDKKAYEIECTQTDTDYIPEDCFDYFD